MERTLRNVLLLVLAAVFVGLGWRLLGAERELVAKEGPSEAPAPAERSPGAGAARGAAPAGDAAPGQAAPEAPPSEEGARLLALLDDGSEAWLAGQTLGNAIRALPPHEGYERLREIWTRVPVEVRPHVLKPLCIGEGHPEALLILDLAARDPDPGVRERAFVYLTRYAFRWFHDDDEYQHWSERYTHRPVGEVLVENARGFVPFLNKLTGEALHGHLFPFTTLDLRAGDGAGVDLAGILKETGALDMVVHWLAHESVEVGEVGLEWTIALDPGEAWMRVHVLPYVTEPEGVPSKILNKALWALALPRNDWAVEPILDFLDERVRNPRIDGYLKDGVGSAADAIARIGAKRAFPRLVGAALADRSRDQSGERLISYFALSKLAGVPYEESMNAAWWEKWWYANRTDFAPKYAALDVPRF